MILFLEDALREYCGYWEKRRDAQIYLSIRAKALSKSKMSCPLPEQRPKRRV